MWAEAPNLTDSECFSLICGKKSKKMQVTNFLFVFSIYRQQVEIQQHNRNCMNKNIFGLCKEKLWGEKLETCLTCQKQQQKHFKYISD